MTSSLKIRIAASIRTIDAAQLDACANPEAGISVKQENQSDRYNPFISHAFLESLESSGAVGGKTGWMPSHVLVENDGGEIVAAAPAYLKTHSMGEYVFDHAWADAYERAHLEYYPKLQVAVPFTPVTGRRLLVAPSGGAEAEAALILGLRRWREQTQASSIHVTFPTEAEWLSLGNMGFLRRTGQQFHFLNRGYADFAGFLGDLASRKRKMIRREREEALAGGIRIEHLTGSDISEAHWDAFFRFYMDTGARKWGQPYLNRRFFSEVGARLGRHILLVMAKRGDIYIGGALNFIGKDALYGRYWGATEDHPFLHFEVCYYQAIDYALAHGLGRVEAGAQGEHKLARGYLATPTYSAHDIADPRFAAAIDRYLAHERSAVEEQLTDYAAQVPFKKGD